MNYGLRMHLASRKVAQHFVEQGIERIIIPGASGPITRKNIVQAYKTIEEEIPDIIRFDRATNYLTYRVVREFPKKKDRFAAARHLLEESHPEIFLENTAYLDDHAHTGTKMSRLQEGFARIGLEHIQLAVLIANEAKVYQKGMFFVGRYDSQVCGEINKLSKMMSHEEELKIEKARPEEKERIKQEFLARAESLISLSNS